MAGISCLQEARHLRGPPLPGPPLRGPPSPRRGAPWRGAPWRGSPVKINCENEAGGRRYTSKINLPLSLSLSLSFSLSLFLNRAIRGPRTPLSADPLSAEMSGFLESARKKPKKYHKKPKKTINTEKTRKNRTLPQSSNLGLVFSVFFRFFWVATPPKMAKNEHFFTGFFITQILVEVEA